MSVKGVAYEIVHEPDCGIAITVVTIIIDNRGRAERGNANVDKIFTG